MIADSADAADRFEERVFGPVIARSEPGTSPTGAAARSLGAVANRMSHLL